MTIGIVVAEVPADPVMAAALFLPTVQVHTGSSGTSFVKGASPHRPVYLPTSEE